MNRRDTVLTLLALAIAEPLRVFAQAPKARRIGVLLLGTRENYKASLDAFAKRLGALGWEQGRNLAIEARYAENRSDRLPSLAKELVEGRPDLILTSSSPCAVAMREATTVIPVVFTAVADPVALGLVRSLGRPGGNMTGVSSLVIDMFGKQFELLKALVPELERLAVLLRPGHPANKLLIAQLEAVTKSARVKLVVVEAGTPHALDSAFVKAAAERVTAIIVPSDPLYLSLRGRIVQLATENRIATAFTSADFVRAGGLVSFGPGMSEFARSADYADRILRGAKPADLPVEQTDRFEILINRSTAKALGIAIPQSVLMRADEVIE